MRPRPVGRGSRPTVVTGVSPAASWLQCGQPHPVRGLPDLQAVQTREGGDLAGAEPVGRPDGDVGEPPGVGVVLGGGQEVGVAVGGGHGPVGAFAGEDGGGKPVGPSERPLEGVGLPPAPAFEATHDGDADGLGDADGVGDERQHRPVEHQPGDGGADITTTGTNRPTRLRKHPCRGIAPPRWPAAR
jgi:hypothetical protein